jgi:hypothetical protein
MDDIKDVGKAVLQTNDGKCVLFWLFVFCVLLGKSIISNGLVLDQIKYLFFPTISFVLFCKFRTSRFQPEIKTEWWGFFSINAFGLLIIYMEFFK